MTRVPPVPGRDPPASRRSPRRERRTRCFGHPAPLLVRATARSPGPSLPPTRSPSAWRHMVRNRRSRSVPTSAPAISSCSTPTGSPRHATPRAVSRLTPSPNGGREATVRIAKTNLIPTSANPREKHGCFAELRGACAIFWRQVNTRVHRETGRAPASELDRRTHPPAPAAPHTLNLDRAATFSGAGGNQYCNGACPSPHRYLTLSQRPVQARDLRPLVSVRECSGL